jgi:hypothetical protein
MVAQPYQSSSETAVLLKDLAQDNTKLFMSHPYRGLLFTEELSLIRLENEQALFKTGRSRGSVSLGDHIFLYNPLMKAVISAQVCALDIQLDRVVLCNFTVTGRQWCDRNNERVQPQHPVRVNLRCDDCTLSAFLQNISLEGVRLLTYKPAERGLDPRIGRPIKIEFELPVARGKISLAGRLANITLPGPRLALLGLHTFPTIEQSRVIERYITRRKAEILDELDGAIHESMELPSVKELYF